ncbi:hypothetical protein NM208_g10695 [Fusarium decemcellulare]|uniref:Uncharacterized protein n=1 Tax=Fusarium decemcellulare TaxID=57161 RepID=A0ACC1RX27_9HYPO|nr:hypothetical protein NM208_g10695 [Fusarium decemcellulare]
MIATFGNVTYDVVERTQARHAKARPAELEAGDSGDGVFTCLYGEPANLRDQNMKRYENITMYPSDPIAQAHSHVKAEFAPGILNHQHDSEPSHASLLPSMMPSCCLEKSLKQMASDLDVPTSRRALRRRYFNLHSQESWPKDVPGNATSVRKPWQLNERRDEEGHDRHVHEHCGHLLGSLPALRMKWLWELASRMLVWFGHARSSLLTRVTPSPDQTQVLRPETPRLG